MNLKDFKKRLLKNPEFRKEYEGRDLAREIGRMVVEARIIKGITQEKLAEMIETKQPSIARLENGTSLPSFTFLNKIAGAFNTFISVRFDFMKDESLCSSTHSRTAEESVVFANDLQRSSFQPNYYVLAHTESSQQLFEQRFSVN